MLRIENTGVKSGLAVMTFGASAISCVNAFADTVVVLPDGIVVGGPSGGKGASNCCSGNFTPTNQFRTTSTSITFADGGVGHTTFIASASPSVQASIDLQAGTSYVASGHISAAASRRVSYYFEVLAHQNRSVISDITAAGGITGTGALTAASEAARSQLTIDPFQTSNANG